MRGLKGWDRALSPAGLPVSGSACLRAVLSAVKQRGQVSPVPPQLQLSPVDLSELHADLKIQERDEFAWKKLKAEGLDEDGEKEAKLIRNLNGTSFLLTRGAGTRLHFHSACGRERACGPGRGQLFQFPGIHCTDDIRVSVTRPEELTHRPGPHRVAQWGPFCSLGRGLGGV